MQRVVSRSELEAERNSREGSVDSDTVERTDVLHEFEFVERRGEISEFSGGEQKPVEGEGEDDLAFNLFAPSGPSATSNGEPSATQRIRIRSPSADPNRAVGFIRPERDPSYYFTDAPGSRSSKDFASSALTGSEILSLSKIPWPGSTLDWKVLHIPPPSHQQAKHTAASAPSLFSRLIDFKAVPSGKRTRPGKKYRIRVRTKKAAVLKKQESIKAAEEAKEAEYREKKTRRNREKKVKKRARDKVKKMAEEGVVELSGGDGHVVGGGSEDESGEND